MTVNGYLFAAYAVVWTTLFAYLLILNRRQKEVSRQLEDVAESIRRRGSSD